MTVDVTRRAYVFSDQKCPRHGNLLRVTENWYICPVCANRIPATKIVPLKRAAEREPLENAA